MGNAAKVVRTPILSTDDDRYPNVPWDGVLGDNTGAIGYCTHSSILFPTWHRPYVALYEVRRHFEVLLSSALA